MAKSYKVETYSKAREAAERAYEVIPQVNASLARKLPLDKEEAIQQLTSEIWPLVQQEYSADNYTDGMSAELSKSKADDWFKMWYLGNKSYSPRVKAEQAQFEKFQDLVVDGKWYNMPKKELDLKMAELGFDPNNRDSRKQFLDVLSQHQINYDRGQIVKQEVNEAPIYEKLSMVAYPTLTDEAIKQSLSGDFSDARMRGALGADLGAQAMFGLNASSRYLMASPFRIGAADAAVEGGRQIANLGMGLEAQPLAPFGAGVAAGLAPAGSNYIARLLSKGKTNEARPFVRGFRRGVRGADDDLTVERNALSETLGKAWEQSRSAQEGVPVSNAGISGSIEAGAYSDAEKALRVLGYRSRAEEQRLANNVQAAQARLEEVKPKSLFDRYNNKNFQPRVIDDDLPAPAPVAQPEEDLPVILRTKTEYEAPAPKFVAPKQYTKEDVNAAKNDLKRALVEQQAYEKSIPKYEGNVEPKYIEDVIGPNPDNVVTRYGAYAMPDKKMAIEKVLKGDYDQPVQFLRNSSGPAFHKETAPERNALRDMFKAKFEKELATGQSPSRNRAYNRGIAAGEFTNQILTVVEPNMKVNPFAPQEYDTRLKNFKQSEWFQNLPKEKKLAIERALKGEK